MSFLMIVTSLSLNNFMLVHPEHHRDVQRTFTAQTRNSIMHQRGHAAH